MRTTIKFLACFMILVMLPMSAFASTQATFSILPGDDLQSIAGVAELMQAASMSFYAAADSFGMSLNMEDKAVASIQVRASEDGLYVQSESISETPLFIGWEDCIKTLESLAQSSGADADDLAEMKAVLDQVFKTGALPTSVMEIQETSKLTPESLEEAKAELVSLFPEDPEMVQMISDLLDTMVFEEGVFTSDKHDTATMKATMEVTKEQMIAFTTSSYMVTMLTESMKVENPDDSDAEIAAEVEEELAEIKETMEAMDFSYPIAVYTSNDGQTIVAMEIHYSMTITEDDEVVGVDMPLSYYRLTQADGVHHTAQATMTITDDGKTESAQMKASLLHATDGTLAGEAGMYVDGMQITASIDGTTTEEKTEGAVQLYVRENASAYADLSASDRPMVGIGFVFDNVDESILSAIQSATPETALQVLTLKGEEQSNFMADLQNRVMSTLMSVMGAMPSEALALFQ